MSDQSPTKYLPNVMHLRRVLTANPNKDDSVQCTGAQLDALLSQYVPALYDLHSVHVIASDAGFTPILYVLVKKVP